MSWTPTDDEKGDDGAPQNHDELGTAPTMLYMKPVSEDETAKAVIEKSAEDMGGETLMMMPAVSGMSAADALSDDGTPRQGPGPLAGPLPEGEGLDELDSAKTMMYMPAVGGAQDSPEAPAGGFSDEVQRKLAELRGAMGAGGDDTGSSTMAYMPAVGELPVDQAVDRMLAVTGEVPLRKAAAPVTPRVATAPAFPAVDLGEAPTDVSEGVGAVPPPAVSPGPRVTPSPAIKPGPDLDDDDDDDEDLSALTGKRKGGKIFLILFLLVLLGAGGVFAAMLFDWVARPEFLDALPHYQLDL
ncbi:MAG: hypothetical protein ABIK09_16185 [Pseudomonadota bacterium]